MTRTRIQIPRLDRAFELARVALQRAADGDELLVWNDELKGVDVEDLLRVLRQNCVAVEEDSSGDLYRA